MMKNLFQNTEFQLDEILFENKNRAYGAYALRQEADRVLLKAAIIGIGLFAAAAAIPIVAHAFSHQKSVVAPAPSGPIVLRNIPDNTVVKKPEATPAALPRQATFNSSVPTPSHHATTEDPAPKTSDYERATPGFQEVAGPKAPPVTYVAPVAPIPLAPPAEVKPKPKDGVETVVDEEANFSGGIDAFRNKMQATFDTGIFDGSGETLKTVVSFIVETDGTISNVKASGSNADFNREAEQTIKKIKGRWQPAKLHGESVRSYFKFPVTMQFE